jgi:hypothetical protein
LSPTSASFDQLLPFEDWQEIGGMMSRHANACSWWLGDWLAFGRYKYGRRYKDAIAATGLDYQTLRNYTTVARRFDTRRRRADLSFQHHAEVCSLCDERQDYLLDMAATHGWSRNELRRRMRAIGPKPPAGVVRLSVDADRAERWSLAAEHSGTTFQAWVVRTLDEASARALALRTSEPAES